MDDERHYDIQEIDEPNGDTTIILTPRDGYTLVSESGDGVLYSKARVVRDAPPTLGSSVMSHNRMTTVGGVRYDASGNRWLLDADTGIWEQG